MLRSRELTRWIGALAAILVLAYTMPALGGKPGGKPGRGGGKKGPSYEIVQLDDMGGAFTDVHARDINSQRQIVGQVEDPLGGYLAASWTTSETNGQVQSELHLLDLLAGSGVASGINESGEIVGTGVIDGGEFGLYWANAGAAPLPLLALSENVNSYVSGISNDGVIIGRSDSQPVAWRINWANDEPSVWGPLSLPTLDDESFVSAINNNDSDGFATIVGRSVVDQQTAAVAWTVRSLSDGTLTVNPQPEILDGSARARGVNNSGAIVGDAWTPTSTSEAVVWAGDSTQVLDRSKFIFTAWAHDINDNGVIVGHGDYWKNFSQGLRAVVWPSASESMILLDKFLDRDSPFNSLVWADAVNEAGDIVGAGWDGSSYGAFLAIPNLATGVDSRDGVAFGSVPEPSAFVLSTLAMMGVGLGLRRRRRGMTRKRTGNRPSQDPRSTANSGG